MAPINPGSGAESILRFLAERMATVVGQPTYVDNRPGGDHLVEVQNILNSPVDGTSILMIGTATMFLNPEITRNIRPLINVANASAAIIVPAGSPYRSLDELLAAARKSPGEVSLASYALSYQVARLLLEDTAKVRFTYIPYKGANQMMSDLIGNSLDAGVADVGGALPLIRTGKVRALAVTGNARHPDLPNVPPVGETVPNFSYFAESAWAFTARRLNLSSSHWNRPCSR
ncbi:tripartite tricarboxylate transporter substrate binding protein [Variovorax paradoxus]|nr:tripartite tricarboxylate transporter substrate binding protein [Variovorax paradoxus]